MAWAAITDRMVFQEAQEYAAKLDLACVSCYIYTQNITVFNVRPIVSRNITDYCVYNYFEDGTYWKTSSAESPKSYCVYYYVPSKVRYLELLRYIHTHLLPHKGEFPSLMMWQTKSTERFIYSCMMGVFHAPIEAPFDNPLLYFETSTVPTSDWEKKLLAQLEEDKKKI